MLDNRFALPVEEVVPRDFPVPTMGHFHEGATLLGYWKMGDSYLFRGFGGHILCVSAGFLRELHGAHVAAVAERLREQANGIEPSVEDVLEAMAAA